MGKKTLFQETPSEKYKIPGGYYISARKPSDIDNAPPHIREIWRLFLRKANYKDHGHIKRGELLISYNDIREQLQWFIGYRRMRYTKAQCETAMKYLKRAGMITTKKTTRCMVVTVLNYMFYQDPKNYESHNEIYNETQARTTMKPHDKERKEEREECNTTSSEQRDEGSYPARLTNYFRKKILLNNPTYRFQSSEKKWDVVFDRMIRLDKRHPESIKNLIRWVQQDEFWLTNCLSPSKLREKYDELTMKMEREMRKAGGKAAPTTYSQHQDAERRSLAERAMAARHGKKSDGPDLVRIESHIPVCGQKPPGNGTTG
jgi:hypothetical protein